MSPHTLDSYRDSLKLLLKFAAGKRGNLSQLTIDQLGVDCITAFLAHLESRRRNRASTRNVRLSAIHSLFQLVCQRRRGGELHPLYPGVRQQ